MLIWNLRKTYWGNKYIASNRRKWNTAKTWGRAERPCNLSFPWNSVIWSRYASYFINQRRICLGQTVCLILEFPKGNFMRRRLFSGFQHVQKLLCHHSVTAWQLHKASSNKDTLGNYDDFHVAYEYIPYWDTNQVDPAATAVRFKDCSNENSHFDKKSV